MQIIACIGWCKTLGFFLCHLCSEERALAIKINLDKNKITDFICLMNYNIILSNMYYDSVTYDGFRPDDTELQLCNR